MYVVLVKLSWSNIQGIDGTPISYGHPEDGCVGLMPIYATKGDAEAAWPGHAIAEIEETGE